MTQIFDLNNPTVVQNIIAEIENNEERNAKKFAFDAFQVYDGNQLPYTEKQLKAKRPKSFESYTVSDISLSQMTTDKLAKGYKETPLRNITEDSDDVISDRVEEIYDEAGAERALPEMDQNFVLDRETLMWINNLYKVDMFGNVISGGKYHWMPLKRYEYSTIKNKDTGELQVVILNYPDISITSGAASGDGIDNLISESQADSSTVSKTYVLWSDTQHVQVRISKKRVIDFHNGGIEDVKISVDYITIPNNPNNVNPIGILPFVYASKNVSPDNPTRNPITNQSITWNVIESEVVTASNVQGSGVMIFKYPESMQGRFEKLNTGLTSAVELPQSDDPDKRDTDLDYKSPGADLSNMADVSDRHLMKILNQHLGSATQTIEGGNFASGLERLIASIDVTDKITDNQKIYAKLEQKIFKIIKAWEKFLNNKAFNDSSKLKVVFPKAKVVISDGEVLANIKMRMELGLMDEVEALMVLDPNLGKDAAKERIEEIKKSKQVESDNVLTGLFNNANNKKRSDEDPRTGSV